MKLPAVLLLCAVTGYDRPQHGPHISAVTSMTDSEAEDWAIRAALLDPRCYQLLGPDPVTGVIDTTVPPDHAWQVTNAFAVYYGDPIDVAQDDYPLTRRTGFIRPLDARRALTLGAGTRIRSNVDVHTAYVLYCDPAALLASDARYTTDPRGLYFGRLQRLRSLPTDMVVLEATGGGAIDDDLHTELPSVPLIVTSASVYDASWLTIGCLEWSAPANVLSEINNSHAVRFAESILQPMPACGPRVDLKKGSEADMPGSIDPEIAYPIHGSGSLTYQVLPVDW